MDIMLSDQWQVMQDIYDLGEEYELYLDKIDPCILHSQYPGGCAMQPDEWRELPLLGHLQTVLSEDPLFGPEIRTYNHAPWWYRRSFELAQDKLKMGAVLKFKGVDYFCRVWLNGVFLGEHEGHSIPFEFEVGEILKEQNTLMVKVWSPLTFEKSGGRDDPRFLYVVRDMLKGTHEHGDGLLHRDSNPVGIWRDVKISFYDELRIAGRPQINSMVGETGTAEVSVDAVVYNSGSDTDAVIRLDVFDEKTGRRRSSVSREQPLKHGNNEVRLACTVENPRLWNTWDRGGAYLYSAVIRVEGEQTCTSRQRFGIRSVKMERTEETTTYYLNGKRLYIRGTSYYPEIYLSNMHEGRYRRDMEAVIRSGCNMVRVHVHQDKPELYEICDELGLAVMQDTDFNWVHPAMEEWTGRALKIFEAQIRDLYNHPSILTWVCLNEPISPGQPDMGCSDPDSFFVYTRPGPQMYELVSRLDPNRTAIRASFCENDPLSGDSHNYHGSIYGPEETYLAVDGTTEKFNTEFGFDAPPSKESLWRERRIFRRLGRAVGDIGEIQRYQYRYLKYLIEHYRLCKYSPTSGHMQFMFIDCSPNSFYGVYDWTGEQKPGLAAFYESNQPMGVFYKYRGESQGIWLVNDFAAEFSGCTLNWSVTDEERNEIASGSRNVDIAADSITRVCSLEFDMSMEHKYTVRLSVDDASGKTIAWNKYEDPFHHPAHPEGHPYNFSHQYGLRLYRQ